MAPWTTTGTLALVGGDEWTEGCTFDASLLAASGGTDVVVLPTAAAYQHPERVVLRAAEWFGPLGGQVEGLMVVDRASAEDPGMAATVAGARFIYLAGGSPLHLRAVLKKSAVFEALRQALAGGAVVAGAGAGAMVLTDPMVDPRGGALTLGLGLVDNLAVVPHFGDEHDDAHGRSSSARWRWRRPPCRSWPSRRARRSIRDGDGHLALRGGGNAGRLRGGVADRGARRARAETPETAGSVLLLDGHALDHDALGGRARAGADGVDRLDDVEPADDLAEERVERRQAHPVGAADHEELAAVGVGARVGHGQRPDLVAARRRQLVVEAVAGAARARPVGSPPWSTKPGMMRWNTMPS